MRSTLALALLAACSAAFSVPTSLYSTVATSSSSLVPGSSIRRYTAIQRPASNPNGTYLGFNALTSDGTSAQAYTFGTYGSPSSFTFPLMVGGPWPLNTSLNASGSNRGAMGVNDSGVFAITGGQNAGGAATDEHVLTYNGSTFSIIIQEGQIEPNLGGAYATAITAPHILADGTVCFQTGGTTTVNIGALMKGTTVLAKRTETIPAGQLTVTPQTIQRFTNDGFRMGGVDMSYIYQCWLGTDTTTRNSVVVDGTVVAQQGFSLPGSDVTTAVDVLPTSNAVSMSSMSTRNRHYAFRGTFVGGQDFAVFGTVGGSKSFVYEGDAIANDSEIWTVIDGTGVNSYNERIITGSTDNPDAGLASAVVFNNGYFNQVVLRRGDGVDLNGNGLADDGYNFYRVNNDNWTFCDNNRLFMACELRATGATASVGSMLVIDLPITGDVDGSGEVDAADIDFVIAQFGSANPAADVDGSGEVDAADIDIVIANFGRTR
ncbi:MAG: dockerin type I repeat-containing protein [Chthonomonas sp.]|nr:dockerin type I repeat-containing protein [Chthonomonas sp.]